ncbi:MAG: DUF2442 domain-containing protein [Armatimonadetes bacterium]|nr:DUF2442 domain-containing protein [Armatimonadota bacterium]
MSTTSGQLHTSPIKVRPLARTVAVSDDTLTVGLADGRVIVVPLVWFPCLLHATVAARSNWELLGDGDGIHWPDAYEDLNVEGLLAGTRARGAS